MTWERIESAPKDGREVLIARGDSMAVAFWRGDRWNLGGLMYFSTPTHWMPKPPPPPSEGE